MRILNLPKYLFIRGNGFRGKLRDLAAEYMMDKLEVNNMDLELFYLFWSWWRNRRRAVD